MAYLQKNSPFKQTEEPVKQTEKPVGQIESYDVTVDTRMEQTNKQTGDTGKYRSKSVSNSSIKKSDGSTMKSVSSNKVKGDKGKYRSASVRHDENGDISGNFTRGDKGKYITGSRAERKFNRWSKRLNR